TAIITYPRPVEVSSRNPDSQRVLADLVKNTPNLDVKRFLDELCATFGVPWSDDIEATHAGNLIMSWDQVRALSRAGMDVESHSRWHRVLQTLDDSLLRDELVGSKQDLESQLGRPCRAIAYPVGRRIAHVSRIRDAVKAAGYRVGLTNASGATRIWSGSLGEMLPCDRFDISRVSTDRTMSDAMFFTQVAVPRLAYIGRHEQ
ncbi:MAG TPA: polysaccharide deacetylase family protein, partial [Kofleriaceae bacterium]